MNKPNGKDLFATLIKLLAEQEGVTINYKIEEGVESEESN